MNNEPTTKTEFTCITYENNNLIRYLYTIRPGKTEFTCITYKSHNLIRFLYTITQTGQVRMRVCSIQYYILCTQRVQWPLNRTEKYFTVDCNGHQDTVSLDRIKPRVCADADPTGVHGVYSSLCRELHVFLSRFLLRTFPCLFLSFNVSTAYILRFEFYTKETACACKSLCTKHVRHCVLWHIRKFKTLGP